MGDTLINFRLFYGNSTPHHTPRHPEGKTSNRVMVSSKLSLGTIMQNCIKYNPCAPPLVWELGETEREHISRDKALYLIALMDPSVGKDGNQLVAGLFFYLPDRIHEVGMCIKQVLHDLIPTALSQ